jgi:hypothetical protein
MMGFRRRQPRLLFRGPSLIIPASGNHGQSESHGRECPRHISLLRRLTPGWAALCVFSLPTPRLS